MGLPSNGTTSEPSQLPGHTWNPMGSLRDCGSVSRGVGGHQKKSRFQILYAYIYIPKINTWQKLCLFSKIKSYTVLVFWGEVNFTKSYLSLLYF